MTFKHNPTNDLNETCAVIPTPAEPRGPDRLVDGDLQSDRFGSSRRTAATSRSACDRSGVPSAVGEKRRRMSTNATLDWSPASDDPNHVAQRF